MNTKRILIVDDDLNLRKILSDILRVKGYAPVGAATGKQALDRVEEETPAVALIDLKLEDMSGLELMGVIKERSPTTECIVLTGYATQASAIEAINLGAYSYVQKPYDMEQLLLTIRRVAEKLEAEEALRESEERYRTLVAGVPVGINRTTPEGKTLDANSAMVHMLGYPDREALLAVNATDLYVDPEDRRRWQALIEHEGVVHGFEVQLRRRDGTTIWVRSNARTVCDADGRVMYYEGSLEDITERVRAEEAQRSTHRTLRAAFDAIQDNMNVVDLDFNLTDVNDAIIKVFDLPDRGSVLGRKCFEVLKGRKDLCPNCAVAEAYRTGAPAYRTTTPEDEVAAGGRSFEIFAYPIMDEHGTLSGAVEFARDITERVRAKEALQQSFEKVQRTLEGMVNALVSTIEIRDPYTAGHQRRVTRLACAIANEMDLSEERIEGLRVAGLIHDLGKISIPALILGKPGPLNGLEYGLIKMHPQIGYDVLKEIDFPWPVAEIVLQHHERMDGSGYPQGLSGEEIMLEARILAVADVVEAMASHRPYRSAPGLDKALEEISQNRGGPYDPEAVDTCLRLFNEKGFAFEER